MIKVSLLSLTSPYAFEVYLFGGEHAKQILNTNTGDSFVS